jgi:hypothetical protein
VTSLERKQFREKILGLAKAKHGGAWLDGVLRVIVQLMAEDTRCSVRECVLWAYDMWMGYVLLLPKEEVNRATAAIVRERVSRMHKTIIDTFKADHFAHMRIGFTDTVFRVREMVSMVPELMRSIGCRTVRYSTPFIFEKCSIEWESQICMHDYLTCHCALELMFLKERRGFRMRFEHGDRVFKLWNALRTLSNHLVNASLCEFVYCMSQYPSDLHENIYYYLRSLLEASVNCCQTWRHTPTDWQMSKHDPVLIAPELRPEDTVGVFGWTDSWEADDGQLYSALVSPIPSLETGEGPIYIVVKQEDNGTMQIRPNINLPSARWNTVWQDTASTVFPTYAKVLGINAKRLPPYMIPVLPQTYTVFRLSNNYRGLWWTVSDDTRVHAVIYLGIHLSDASGFSFFGTDEITDIASIRNGKFSCVHQTVIPRMVQTTIGSDVVKNLHWEVRHPECKDLPGPTLIINNEVLSHNDDEDEDEDTVGEDSDDVPLETLTLSEAP